MILIGFEILTIYSSAQSKILKHRPIRSIHWANGFWLCGLVKRYAFNLELQFLILTSSSRVLTNGFFILSVYLTIQLEIFHLRTPAYLIDLLENVRVKTNKHEREKNNNEIINNQHFDFAKHFIFRIQKMESRWHQSNTMNVVLK